jgi:capsular polysaccharide transport system permease protein
MPPDSMPPNSASDTNSNSKNTDIKSPSAPLKSAETAIVKSTVPSAEASSASKSSVLPSPAPKVLTQSAQTQVSSEPKSAAQPAPPFTEKPVTPPSPIAKSESAAGASPVNPGVTPPKKAPPAGKTSDSQIVVASSPSKVSSSQPKSLAGSGTPPPPLSELFPVDSEHFAVPPTKKKKLLFSFLICVGLPVLLATIYYGIIASDQYATVSQFIIHTRSLIPTGPSAIPGAGMTVVSPLALSDMLVVQDYVGSQQILKDLQGKVDIRSIYSTNRADWFARLKPMPALRRVLNGQVFNKGLMGSISEEDLLEYWKKRVAVKFDMTTGIATLTVKAFSAPDSLLIAEAVLKCGENLVNQLSERSLEDALKFAKTEVSEAQIRATQALDDLQSFQSEAQEVDPEGYAVARGTLQAKLDADLSLYQSQLELLRKSLPENAPGIQQLKSKILVAQNQIQSERTKSTAKGTNASASQVLNEFAKKKLDVDFATQAYVSALEYLEAARASAMQQSRYLEAFVRPQLADEAEYPRRLHAVLLVLLASSLLWGIGYLLISAAKEHI